MGGQGQGQGQGGGSGSGSGSGSWRVRVSSGSGSGLGPDQDHTLHPITAIGPGSFIRHPPRPSTGASQPASALVAGGHPVPLPPPPPAPSPMPPPGGVRGHTCGACAKQLASRVMRTGPRLEEGCLRRSVLLAKKAYQVVCGREGSRAQTWGSDLARRGPGFRVQGSGLGLGFRGGRGGGRERENSGSRGRKGR